MNKKIRINITIRLNKSKTYFFKLLDVSLSGFNSRKMKMTNAIIITVIIPDIVL